MSNEAEKRACEVISDSRMSNNLLFVLIFFIINMKMMICRQLSYSIDTLMARIMCLCLDA